MGRNHMWVFFIVPFIFFPMAYSEDEDVKKALLRFMEKLEPGNTPRDIKWGWNLTTDPCIHEWHGVKCYSNAKFVKSITLEDSGFKGTLDATSLCKVKLLKGLSLKNNKLHGLIPEEIGTCKALSLLYLSGNNFSGRLPLSLPHLSNLKRIDLSNNNFSGDLPDMSHVSGLLTFRAQNNNFTGEIPSFDFSNLKELNVSNNNLRGPIPDVKGLFSADSFSGNPNLCGTPLPNLCPPPPPPPPPNQKRTRKSFSDGLVIHSGYVILGVLVLLFLTLKIGRRLKGRVKAESSSDAEKKELVGEVVRSEYSLRCVESVMSSSTLVVMSNPVVRTLRFEDLLRAPAEVVGRGKHGSMFKVMMENGVALAVKRMKDCGISKQDFERRMHKIDQVKHPCVHPLLAYYCSQQEKLLVYEYLHNGSLSKILHGSQSGETFEWRNRLNVAASIAEALAYMHEELRESGIAHGNLKSTNILFDTKMDPCLSEYGLMVVENQDQSMLKNTNLNAAHVYSTFKVDTYAFGVVLLELLTGKVVQNNGSELAKWMNSVVREEWSVEVFDKCLTSEGASEERMMNLLQIALKCVSPSPNDRPDMSEVAVMTISLKEEEERSVIFQSQRLLHI